jgi:hypothetical protein
MALHQKQILLDFDGVLIPKLFSSFAEQMTKMSRGEVNNKDDFGEFFSPSSMHNLRLLIEETDASIVFTTNWRKPPNEGGVGYMALREMWQSRYDFGHVMGATPVMDPALSKRGNEIAQWLRQNPASNYVILDDMGPSMFLPEQLPHLVTCPEEYGFTNSALEKAYDILA